MQDFYSILYQKYGVIPLKIDKGKFHGHVRKERKNRDDAI